MPLYMNSFGPVSCCLSLQYIVKLLTTGASFPQAIEYDYCNKAGDCFTRLLEDWLTQSTPLPICSALIEALKSPAVGREDIAKNIEAMTTKTEKNNQSYDLMYTLYYVLLHSTYCLHSTTSSTVLLWSVVSSFS